MISGFLNHSANYLEPQYQTDLSAGVTRGEQPWPYLLHGELIRVEDASANAIATAAARGILITHRVFTTSDKPKNGGAWHFDNRYYIVREILRRRALGGIGDYFINMCHEVAPSG